MHRYLGNASLRHHDCCPLTMGNHVLNHSRHRSRQRQPQQHQLDHHSHEHPHQLRDIQTTTDIGLGAEVMLEAAAP